MAEKTKSLETAPQKTPEAASPSRTPAPSVSPGGFDLATIQGAAGNMAMQRAAREEGGEDAPVRSESALKFLYAKNAAQHNPLWQSLAMRSGVLQPKLTISQSDDPYEREADRVADQVMRMPAPQSSGHGLSITPVTSRQTQRKCAKCEGEEEEGKLQRKESDSAEASVTAPPIVYQTLSSPGQPLDAATRAYFEPRFGHDFSGVRIHTGGDAVSATHNVQARAFTVANQIAFAAGQYTPHSETGRRLLAHELTHTLQQHGAHTATVQRQDLSTPTVNTGAPAEGVNPIPAFNALDEWRIKAAELITGTWRWEMGNWIDFLGRTSSNPQLSLADSDLAGVASNALGNLLTELGSDAMKKAAQKSAALLGAAIGTAIEPGAGTVIGFLLGVLIESAASWVFENVTGKSDPDQTAADASERLRELLAQQHTLLAAQYAGAIAQLESFIAVAKLNAEHADTQAKVDSIAAWAAGEAEKTKLPNPEADRSMSERLLKIWVLEHAGNVGSAHGDTSPEQWEQALGHVFSGATRLKNQPTLFAFQTRAEWEKAGLDHSALTESMMSQANQIVAALLQKEAQRAAPVPPGAAKTRQPFEREVQAAFHDKTYYTIRVKNPEAFLRYVADHHDAMWYNIEYLQLVREGRVYVDCTLDVAISGVDVSAYIDEWNWEVEIANTKRAKFDVWPTWG
jgi:Domain of unknown function (DUF4157)